MCGRFDRHRELAHFNAAMGGADCSGAAAVPANYNVAPSQSAWVVHGASGKAAVSAMSWGFVPEWASETRFTRPINARSETAHEKPMFRTAFSKQRCLVLCDGYYEWQNTDNGKQPFYIYRNDGGPLYFGGLHQRNKDHEFVILTQESEGAIKPIHHRMPLLLNENQFDQFFDYEKSVSSLSREQSVELSYHPISRQVNSPKNNGIELINKV